MIGFLCRNHIIFSPFSFQKSSWYTTT